MLRQGKLDLDKPLAQYNVKPAAYWGDSSALVCLPWLDFEIFLSDPLCFLWCGCIFYKHFSEPDASVCNVFVLPLGSPQNMGSVGIALLECMMIVYDVFLRYKSKGNCHR